MGIEDQRRRIPRTDHLLSLSAVTEARTRLDEAEIRAVIAAQQELARSGAIAAEQVEPAVERELRGRRTLSLRPVLNATGVVVHTNLGRAPLSAAAREAIGEAAGYVDVEMDLGSGKRSSRGAGAREALLRACPDAEDALIVNNGAAALLLAVTAFCTGPGDAAGPREAVVSRGELVEIGAGFRLPELMTAAGARLREVGTTNRTHADDYAEAIGDATGCLLKIHPSNFRVHGFTAEVGIAALRRLADEHGLPLVADLGSGLLHPDPALPDEPDISSALRAGADVVIASGDKLFGGPQAGLLLGRREAIRRLARHPLARAVRSDKLALAAVEATLRGPEPPVSVALHADPARLRERTERLADRLAEAVHRRFAVVPHDGRVGGGGAPGVPLAGWALELPEAAAERLRAGTPAVVARVRQDRCLVDPRCVPESDDDALLACLVEALGGAEREAGPDGAPSGIGGAPVGRR
ncbi:L-seryl-tRNA(Sec) selenium transferase [Leucobacter sp. CSA1]|uniref:L-seryl-tRNA(Sec) selenium transferase n=1 Tax=Leucobacter chromiisoli TaxID=2796471 RepID=A0A934Q6S3_9MICO|nr:L-seryl-tRNA(Sec) selenium transferase [Leucobacter chromiisoli]MBK0417622.1 L-seryl-tRNA(Sec) selenium transferase [Leucobacter chromiisoli]